MDGLHPGTGLVMKHIWPYSHCCVCVDLSPQFANKFTLQVHVPVNTAVTKHCHLCDPQLQHGQQETKPLRCHNVNGVNIASCFLQCNEKQNVYMYRWTQRQEKCKDMEALGIFFLITINQLFALVSLSSSTAHLPLLNLAACTSCSYINQGMFCYIASQLVIYKRETVEFEKSFTKQIRLMLSNYQSACLK